MPQNSPVGGIPLFVLGRGANTIFGDFEGIVINTKMLRDLKIKGCDGGLEIVAQAGVPLNTLVELGVTGGLSCHRRRSHSHERRSLWL